MTVARQSLVVAHGKGSQAERGILFTTPAALVVVLCVTLHCNERPSVVEQSAPKASAHPIAQPELPAAASASPPARAQPSDKKESAAEAAAATRKYEELVPASWTLSELSDVGPAGPATATASGVVMVTLDGKLPIGRWHADGTVGPIDEPKSSFAAYGRGPALAGRHAYWIRSHYLLRRPLRGEAKPEILANDAREGTRVAAELVGKDNKVVVAYIARSGEDLVARLWIEGKILPLTPEGSQATSVNLVPSDGDLVAVILEGRTSMSPVHARRLLLRGKLPRVGEDVVVWVGPPSQPLSEIVSLAGNDGDTWSFLALEKTVTDFGLANFRIDKQPEMDVKVSWIAYPNGINPAPVATGFACGKPTVLFARPSESRPHSPQELRVAKLEGSRLGPSEVVARSKAFNNISLAAVKSGTKQGALLTWTADWRTWARTIFCK